MCGVELTDETVREFSQVAMAMMNLKSRINEIISEWVEPGRSGVILSNSTNICSIIHSCILEKGAYT